jgi:hypothetical protein
MSDPVLAKEILSQILVAARQSAGQYVRFYTCADHKH